MPEPKALKDPEPVTSPVRLRLCPLLSVTVLDPDSVNAFPTKSGEPPAVVVIAEFTSASVEPLSVKTPVLPEVPLFVNDIVPSVIVPMSFVLVV